ncbi:MAG: trypsin-like peptidase domain-containing protein, partial [Desulfosarcinaceae bacterium]
MSIRKYYRFGIFIVVLAAFLTLGLTQCHSSASGSNVVKTSQAATIQPQQTPMLNSDTNLVTAIAKVARDNIPAVVHINVTQEREVSNPMLPFSNDPFFHFFFNNPRRRMPRKFKQELRALGTGMIMDQKGDILTNNHVVAGANTINVLMSDGRSYPAKLVGADPKTDLAVIRIKADGPLPTVKFGDSDKVDVGQWVVAIGQPEGLDNTVTQGIISAKHRTGVLNPVTYQDYLQTDAAINPGNSGGPLLTLNGQVIGVNAAIATQSGGFEGIGFAIPSNMAV